MQIGALNAGAGAIAKGLETFASSSARAAAGANAVSKTAQDAAAKFNQGSADIANQLNMGTLAGQYNFNSGQAAMANQFSEYMWDKAAGWNESMFNKQMEFNAAEAQKNRDWQEKMRATAYQTAVKDMELAGLNPILAATSGIQASNLGGGSASVSSPTMGSASGAMASGGLLGANDASISGYTGQMQYMGGMLGLLSAALGGISSAVGALGSMGQFGEKLGDAISRIFEAPQDAKNYTSNIPDYAKQLPNYLADPYKYKKDFGDTNNAYNRYYNTTSSHYIGNRGKKSGSSGKW